MGITAQEARAELARRELERRKLAKPQDSNKSIGNFFEKAFREQAKTSLSNVLGKGFGDTPAKGMAAKAGYGAIPALEQFPTGLEEGVKSALSALIGKDYQNTPIPEEYGSGFGRGAGQLVGQGAVAAVPGGMATKGLAAVGVPNALAGILGTGAGFAGTTQGDALERTISGLEAAGFHAGGKLIGSILKGEIPLHEIGSKLKSAFSVPSKGKKYKSASESKSAKQAELEEAEQSLNAQNQDYEQTIERHKPIESSMIQDEVIKGTDKDILVRRSKEAATKAGEKRAELAKEPEMETAKMPQKPLVSPKSLEEDIESHQSLLKTHEQKLAQQEENLTKVMGGKNREHGVPVAEHVVETVEGKVNPETGKKSGGIKQDIGKQYDAIEKKLENKNVELPRTPEVIKIENETREFLEEFKPLYDSDKEFEEVVQNYLKNKVPEGKDIVPANEFLRNYRTMRQLSQKMKASVYEKGITRDESAFRAKKAKEMNDTANNMEKLLENHNLGGELEELRAANKRWREEVTPLYNNKTYKTFLNEGFSSNKNLAETLRGNKPGQIIIKNIIKKNPEMVNRVVAMSHAEKPSSLLEPYEGMEQFIDLMPKEFKQGIEALKIHKGNIAQTKQNLSQLEKQHGKNVKTETLNKQEQARRDKVSQSYDKMIQLDADSAALEHAAEKAKILADEKNISLKEKAARKKVYDKANKEHKKAVQEHTKAEKEYEKSKKDAAHIGLAATGLLSTGLGIKGVNYLKNLNKD